MIGRTNSISVAGKDYNPANAKQYREHNRNSAWPTIPLPSEMRESSDHIFFLVDLAVPKRFFSLNFVGADTNNIIITSKYYKDTELAKSETEPALTSTNYEKYYTADSGENYLIVEIEAARGNISKLAVGLTGNYGYYGVDSGILEISGNCNSIAIQMNGNANLLRTLRMEYFSFYGLYQYGENNLYLGSTSSDTSGSLKSVPELKFVNTVLYLDWMFRYCSELVSIDDTAFSGYAISGLGDTFRDCQNLINCGYTAIRMELIKNAVKTYYYYRKKKTSENSEYYNTISMINIGLEKYGVGKTKVVFEDSDIVDKLCTSFITERIKYDHKSELDYVIDDEAKFLVASIDSYYSKNKEV